MRITVAAHKGGAGKTTTSVMLAWLLARQGAATVLVDADRQGSATTWWNMAERHEETWPESLTIAQWPLELPPADLSHVVIDTGPGDPERLRATAALCDLTVVVTSPLPADVAQVGATIADVETSGSPLVGDLLAPVMLSTIPALDTIVPWSVPRYARAFGTVPTLYSAGAYADVLAELLTPVEA